MQLVVLIISVSLPAIAYSQSITGCSTYGPNTADGKPTCTACYNGFLLRSDLLGCDACATGCAICATTGCKECSTNYFMTPENSCQSCPLYCSKCTNGSSCTTCQDGYFLGSGQCLKCNNNCNKCDASSPCTSCNEGFELSGNECKIKKTIGAILYTIFSVFCCILCSIICMCQFFTDIQSGKTPRTRKYISHGYTPLS